MSGPSINNSETKLEALTLPSSAYGVPVAIVGGTGRVPVNLIDYFGFTALAHTESEGGKGGEITNTTYTYTVSYLMGVGHGNLWPARTWRGKEVLAGGLTAAQVQSADVAFTPPASGAQVLTSATLANCLGAPLVVHAVGASVVVLSEGADYKWVGQSITMLTDAWRGVALSVRYQYSTVANYIAPGMSSVGASFAVGRRDQTAPAWITADNPPHALAYPGLSYLHAQDYQLGNSSSLDIQSIEVNGFGAFKHATPDCNIAEFVAHVLTQSGYGAGIPGDVLDFGDWITYCRAAGLLMSPVLTAQTRAADLLTKACELTGCEVVQGYNRIRVLPLADLPVTGNGVTYTPNTTPVYDITPDFMIGDVPFTRTLKLPADLYNSVTVTYKNRATYYAPAVATVEDDGDIAINGRRPKDAVQAPWIATPEVANIVAGLIMRKALTIKGGGTCRVPWAMCMLEPGDLVTVLDPVLGDDPWNMRVTRIDEDEWGFLTLTLEDWPLGVADPTLYTTEVPGGYLHDYNADPGSVDIPAMFELPAALAGMTGIEVAIAARGASAAYGGCEVWVSFDGTNYRSAGTIYGNSRMGTLKAAITGASTSMTIEGLASADLLPASATDAAQLETLCYLGSPGEYLAYQGSTLNGPGEYTLSGLVRAAYKSPAASHGVGARFVRIDDQLARSGYLQPSMIGQQVYIKATAFNLYGRAHQALSAATAYAYTVTGEGAGYDPGIVGKGVDLQASALLFKYPVVGGSPSPASITLTAVRKGGLAGTVAFSVTAGTATLTDSGDSRTLTAADLTSATATIRATITDPVATYTSEVTISKVYDGADGVDGSDGPQGLPGPPGTPGSDAQNLVVVATPRQNFAFDGSGAPAPAAQTITFTARTLNITGTATWVCERFDATGASLGTLTMGGSGNARTLTVAQFGAAQYAEVTATISPFTDTVSVIRLKDGAGNVAFDLDNDSHTFPADASGNVLSYAGASAEVTVWEGLVDKTSTWTITKSDSSGVTSSISGDTVTVSGMTAATDTGQVNITISKAGFTSQTKPFKLLKARSAPGSIGVLSGTFLSAVDSDLTAPYAMDCQVKFTKNGTVTRTGDITGSLLWYEPQTTGIGNTHWLKVVELSTVGSGNTFTGTLNTVQALSTDRVYRLQGANNMEKSLKYYIYADAAGTQLLGTGTVELNNLNGL